MNDETLDTLGQLDTATRSSVLAVDRTFEPRVPGFTILGHPDTRRTGERCALLPLASGQEIDVSRLTPLFAQPGDSQRRPLADPHLSRRALRIVPSADGGLELINTPRVRAEVDGVALGERWRGGADTLHRGIVLLLADRIVLLLHWMDVVSGTGPTYDLVGESREIHALRQQISRVADLAVPVLLRGETGTGKEMVARGLHQASRRRSAPFVAVNMGAVPPSLAAAELFGSTKGAFTGADRRRRGYFAQADGGTLFLDEIGETPGEIQALLLRTLETGVVHPVGADEPRSVDVRVLAATDADLESEIDAGRFRAPLLHRLSGYEIRLPALRERRDDIGRLLLHFLRRELEAIGDGHRLETSDPRHPWLPGPLVARLAGYPWPGNVRQLRNVARQLVIANQGAARLVPPPELETLLRSVEPLRSEPLATPVAAGLRGAARPMPEPVPASDRPVLRALVAIRWAAETEPPGLRRRRHRDQRVRSLLARYDGHEVAKHDGFLMVFERPADAVGFALSVHEEPAEDAAARIDPIGVARIGVAFGEVYVRANAPEVVARGAQRLEIEGAARDLAEWLAERALGGQTLLDRGAHELARQAARAEQPVADDAVRWLDHGRHAGSPASGDDGVEVFEVGVDGLAPCTSPFDVAPGSASASPKVYRSPSEIDETELIATLRRNAYRLLPTAEELGISRTSLYALIDRSDSIRKARDLGRDEIEASRARHDGDLDAMAAELEVSRKGLSRRITELAD